MYKNCGVKESGGLLPAPTGIRERTLSGITLPPPLQQQKDRARKGHPSPCQPQQQHEAICDLGKFTPHAPPIAKTANGVTPLG